MSLACECGASRAEHDRFCAACGRKVAPDACPGCAVSERAGDSFCATCGRRTSQSKVAWKLPEPSRVCTACTHFRPRRFATDALPGWKATPVNNALMEVKKEELKLESLEAEEMMLAEKRQATEWSQRPRAHAHCAAHAQRGVFHICELKNAGSDCPDFSSIAVVPRSDVRCQGCMHVVSRKVDPYPPQGPLSAELHTKQLENVDTQIALEIVSLFHRWGESVIPVEHHDFCHRHHRAVPYANLYGDCPDRSTGLSTHPLFDKIRAKGKP